ncbi:MAG: hypothetical protein QXS95_02210 [Candidatus Nitrosocaldus sp.]
MDMPVTSIQLYHFLEALVDSVCSAVDDALKDSIDEPITFIPSSIDVSMRCSLEYDNGVYITPSNALVANYYGKGDGAIVKARLTSRPALVSRLGMKNPTININTSTGLLRGGE